MDGASEPKDGLQYAYRYRDAATGLVELACDERLAARESRGAHEVVLAEFRDGRLSHVPGEPSCGNAPLELLRPHKQDGLGHVFRYADPHTGRIAYTPDETLAQLASGGDYQPVWAHFRGGRFVRFASRHEMRGVLLGRVYGIIRRRLDEEDQPSRRGASTWKKARWIMRSPRGYVPLVAKALDQARGEQCDAIVADDVTEGAWRFPNPAKGLF